MTEIEDIAATVASVAHFIDAKRWTDLRGLYASKVRTDYTSLFGGEVQTQGGDELIGAWKTLLTPIVTQHLLGPVTVRIDAGAHAVAECHVRGYHFAEGTPGGDEWMVAGHYTFGMTKIGAGWLVEAMTLNVLYQSGNRKLLELRGGK